MKTNSNPQKRLTIDIQSEISDLRRLATNLADAATRSREEELIWVYAMEGNRDGPWDWNAVTNEVFFSPRWKEMLGFKENEIKDELSEWDKRIHPDDKDTVYADLNAHLEGKTSFFENEHRLQCKDGAYIWALDRGKVLSWTKDGKPLRVVGSLTDVTLRKEAEIELVKRTAELVKANRALKDSEEKFRSLSEAAFDGIVISDQGIGIEVNKRLADMYGYKLSEVIGRETICLIAPGERETVKNKIAAGDERPYETLGIKKDGSLFPIEVRARFFRYQGKRVRVSTIRDLTEQKRAQEEIKTLRGILPICSSCKKIRDDKGNWIQVEAFIKDRSEAEFSHDICPECAKKLYPEFF